MVELVNAADSKSAGGNTLRVQVSLPVPERTGLWHTTDPSFFSGQPRFPSPAKKNGHSPCVAAHGCPACPHAAAACVTHGTSGRAAQPDTPAPLYTKRPGVMLPAFSHSPFLSSIYASRQSKGPCLRPAAGRHPCPFSVFRAACRIPRLPRAKHAGRHPRKAPAYLVNATHSEHGKAGKTSLLARQHVFVSSLCMRSASIRHPVPGKDGPAEHRSPARRQNVEQNARKGAARAVHAGC